MPRPKPHTDATVSISFVTRGSRIDATICVRSENHASWTERAWSRSGSLDALSKAVDKLEVRVSRLRRGPRPIGDRSLDFFRPKQVDRP